MFRSKYVNCIFIYLSIRWVLEFENDKYKDYDNILLMTKSLIMQFTREKGYFERSITHQDIKNNVLW